MCNDGWNDKYASLVCAQMGLGSLGEIADFGAGTGSIFLERVICSLNDTVLASCGHYGVDVRVLCNHKDDVGLKCDGMYVELCFIFFTSSFHSLYSIAQRQCHECLKLTRMLFGCLLF